MSPPQRSLPHTVLRESTSLVTEQVLYPSQFLWQSTSANYSIRYFWVVHDLLSIYRLPHVQVNPETKTIIGNQFSPKTRRLTLPDWDDGGEQDEEAEDIHIPLPSEAVQGN